MILIKILLQNKRATLILVALVAALIISWVLYIKSTTGTLHITSDPGALISISTSQGGEFREIGTGNASYSSRKDGETVYFKVELNENVSVSADTIIAGQDIERTLNVENAGVSGAKDKLFDGTVGFPLVEGKEAFGVSPDTSSIVNFGTEEFLPPRASLIGIPSVQDVIWTSSTVFVYDSIAEGIGISNNGINPFLSEGGSAGFIDVAKFQGRPYVLIADGSVHLMDKLDGLTRKIRDITETGILSVYSNGDSLSYAAQPYPGEYTDEIDGEESSVDPVTKVVKLGYSGDLLDAYSVNGAETTAIFEVGSTDVVFDERGFSTHEPNSDAERTYSYFEDNHDVIQLSNGRIVALSEGGLWLVDPTYRAYRQVMPFNADEHGARNSLRQHGDILIFGLEVNGSGATYKLSLNQLQ